MNNSIINVLIVGFAVIICVAGLIFLGTIIYNDIKVVPGKYFPDDDLEKFFFVFIEHERYDEAYSRVARANPEHRDYLTDLVSTARFDSLVRNNDLEAARRVALQINDREKREEKLQVVQEWDKPSAGSASGRTVPAYFSEEILSDINVTGSVLPRFALVIGNSSYTKFPSLKNPSADTKAVSQMLTRLGFSVDYLADADKRDMLESVRAFGDTLKDKKGVGLFYYAGHGIEHQGENYLIPLNSQIEDQLDVEYEAVSVNRIIDEMVESQNAMNIVILDACRDNPIPSATRSVGRGLSVINASLGSLIVFSTSPGQVAYDGEGDLSPFAGALINNMAVENLEIRSMLTRARRDVINATEGKQIPWDSSSLVGEFYFYPRQEH